MKTTRLITAIVCVAAFAAATLADDGYADPEELPKAQGTLWTSALILALAVAGIAVLAFKNPKRTHLD